MKVYLLRFIFFALIALPTTNHGKNPVNGLGIAIGYTGYNTLKGEVWLNHNFQVSARNAELKFGVSNRTYTFSFDKVDNLQAKSIGIFADVLFFPFQKGFFGGLRWELINGNWLTASSNQKVQEMRGYNLNDFYTGSCMLLQFGYSFQLNDKLNIRMFGQPGIQQFRISNGVSTTGNYNQSASNNIKIENKVAFIYDINLAIGLKIN